jgi:hypothetical protein
MMRQLIGSVLGVCLLVCGQTPSFAREMQVAAPLPAANRKQARAVRIADGTIRVDGRLDDVGWRNAVPVTDFTQKEPVEGAEPTERTEVYFAFDADALYVGARMYSRDVDTIRAPLSRRDVVDQTDLIAVYLDTFLDRRTAYAFAVTPSGVRMDRYYSRDAEWAWDNSFDPVWEAKAAKTATGWTAEMWIPFSQLRFNDMAEQVWGLNVYRNVPFRNERDFWIATARTESRFASQFGTLHGIRDIEPSRRLELAPYIAGSSTINGDRDPADPFDDGRNLSGRVGADMKMGLGPNLTLNMTVNPDFGQVEADPAEVNLSGFETFFDERRPFFTENARLLTLGNNHFYSRRIGAPPTGEAEGDFVRRPQTSTIATAAKLTGRLASGTSVGVLGALTNDEFARVFAEGVFSRVRVGARTAYGVARVQQEIGASGSTISAIVTGMHRDVEPGEALADQQARSSYTTGVEAALRLHDSEYELRLEGAASGVSGEPGAIEEIQRSSVRYLQRPDRRDERFDPTLTSLHGYMWTGSLERVNGENWLFDVSSKFETPGFDTNEVGRLRRGDSLEYNGGIRYRETDVGRHLRFYSVGFQSSNEYTFAGERQVGSLRHFANMTLSNFWDTGYSVSRDMEVDDGFLTRGGPKMTRPPEWNANVYLNNSGTSQTQWNVRLAAGGTADGGMRRRVNAGATFRPGPRWRIQLNPVYERSLDTQQYVATIEDGPVDTFGSRYVFSRIDRSTMSTQLRVAYTLKPDVNIDVYAEPFAASGRYFDLGELAAPGTADRRLYGTDGTMMFLEPDGTRTVVDGDRSFTLDETDFNVRSFRSNVVLRWEYRPGSTVYLVWQQSRNEDILTGRRAGVRDMFDSLTSPGSNFFAVKTSFWIPVR